MLVRPYMLDKERYPGPSGCGLGVRLTSSPNKISIVSKPWKLWGQGHGQKMDQSATEEEYMSGN